MKTRRRHRISSSRLLHPCVVSLFLLSAVPAGRAHAQDTDSLRRGDRLRITTAAGSVVDGRLRALWLPDSLRLFRPGRDRDLTFGRSEMAHLDVSRDHGMAGVALGLAVGAFVGAGLTLSLASAMSDSHASFGDQVRWGLLGVGAGVTIAVPIFGLIGSGVSTWKRVF